MFDTKLIERALELKGTPIYDMKRGYSGEYEVEWDFCMAEFCVYLLSHNFIEKYYLSVFGEEANNYSNIFHGLIERFGVAIYEYQRRNEQPLIDLLSKI